jgi:ATP-dependent Lhr-like helicase
VGLASFSDPTRAWFEMTFGAPTEAQLRAWPAISGGDHVLLCAPTGSGKTLAAFLWAIDRLGQEPADGGTRVVYVSPLRALAVDVDKNLRAPLRGIDLAAHRLGSARRAITVGVRTGDSDAAERRRLRREPPDILITTPESLYLMLTSAARDTLVTVDCVIVDEIHALAATKRGAHLALSLERLARLTERPPQRIGLSATQRPLEEIAHFLGGNEVDPDARVTRRRPVVIVDAGTRKALDVEVVVPVEDMGTLGGVETGPVSGPAAAGPVRRSIWPAIHPRLLDLVRSHRSTLIFVNARRLAERLASRLNTLAHEQEDFGGAAVGASSPPGEELVKAHHGSLAREQRLVIEDDLKAGRLRGLVATSSLELGIDMGAVDLVVQVESPGSVAAGLQRIGRAGHQVDAPSVGRIFPKHRADLLECAVVVERMYAGEVEHTRFVRSPLDVLAQHVVAACALEPWRTEDLLATVRSAAPFGELSGELFEAVLDLLDGRFPSEEFSGLRPRLVWDRTAGVLRGRPGAQRLAVTNPGTIPDRGHFGVFLPDGTRVGELDEEMVYESRVGETFLLGASTWRIEDITFDRVVVTPAPGQPGKMPFWHGEGPGRPLELGRALGEFVRTIRTLDRDVATDRLRTRHHLDSMAAANVLAYLDEQAEATGVVPDDRTIVVERFRDEIGDWRICVHSPFGARVHAPWAMAIRHRLRTVTGDEVDIMWSDDGIILRLPESLDTLDVEDLLPDPIEVADEVISVLPGTALFAARFRECAARALLLPRRRVDRRTPLWQQRQRAADLLAVAARYPSFPILLETTRECLHDVFDLSALVEVLTGIREHRIRVVSVDTPSASPMAQSLLFSWIAVYMYEGDAPLAERRAAALALDRDLLRDLLGDDELRSLIDPDVLARLESELQRRAPDRRARTLDEVADLMRTLGPLSVAELAERFEGHPDQLDAMIGELTATRRAIKVSIAGEDRWADSADAARLRDALGVALPAGLPGAFTEPVPQPLRDLILRYGSTHGPFTVGEVAGRFGLGPDAVRAVLGQLESDGLMLQGEFRPDGTEREWCHPEVLRRLRRRTLAALRSEVEPVEAQVLGRFLPAWQGVGSGSSGSEALLDCLSQLQGAPLVASTIESDVLAARLADVRSADLDELCTSGDLVWVGAGAIGTTDGRIRLAFRDQAHLLLPTTEDGPAEPHHLILRAHLERAGASFWDDLVAAVAAAGLPHDDQTVLSALWDLVWAGQVTNDSLAPLRARIAGGRSRGARQRSPRVGRLSRRGPPAGAGRWSLAVGGSASPTERAHATALQLIDRYGVLTREMALAEGVTAGFAGVTPVLRALEDQGRVRRGYFVAGLGAAQFAHPGAVDRLRTHRDRSTGVVILAATDPAQPYGAVLDWPDHAGRVARSAGARVILVDGAAGAYVDRRSVVTFPGADPEVIATALGELADRHQRVEVAQVDGAAVGGTALGAALVAQGWRLGYRGLRPPR